MEKTGKSGENQSSVFNFDPTLFDGAEEPPPPSPENGEAGRSSSSGATSTRSRSVQSPTGMHTTAYQTHMTLTGLPGSGRGGAPRPSPSPYVFPPAGFGRGDARHPAGGFGPISGLSGNGMGASSPFGLPPGVDRWPPVSSAHLHDRADFGGELRLVDDPQSPTEEDFDPNRADRFTQQSLSDVLVERDDVRQHGRRRDRDPSSSSSHHHHWQRGMGVNVEFSADNVPLDGPGPFHDFPQLMQSLPAHLLMQGQKASRKEVPFERWIFHYGMETKESIELWTQRGFAMLHLLEGAFRVALEAIAWAVVKLVTTISSYKFAHSADDYYEVLLAHSRGFILSAIAIWSPNTAKSSDRAKETGCELHNWKWGTVYIGESDSLFHNSWANA